GDTEGLFYIPPSRAPSGFENVTLPGSVPVTILNAFGRGLIFNEEAGNDGSNTEGKSGQPASEKTARDIAKRIERDLGKSARRDFHDSKESGAGDRTLDQLKQDARDIYIDAGRDIPSWLK
ncbi:hypothetical protein GPA19_24875, partial [Azoarcus indigens]|nr:hypothetical protein [Azoarcus indigens]